MRAADLFAGLGGFSTGARMAGCAVVFAANHWAEAVEYHRLNHPDTEHACQDLQQYDFTQAPAHDILLASPACQGHSKARGTEKPHHDALRATAWAVVTALECHRPPFGVVENAPEFRGWSLYLSWCDAIARLGYSVGEHLIDAADHGVPQHRERLFLVLTRSTAPLKLTLPRREHVPISRVLNFRDDAGWSPIHKPGRSLATLRRIENGRRQFGNRFVMPYYGSGSGLTGRSIHRPIGTITTKNRWGIVDGDRMRMFSKEESRDAMGFPKDTVLPDGVTLATFMLGNAVAPVVACDVINAIKEQA